MPIFEADFSTGYFTLFSGSRASKNIDKWVLEPATILTNGSRPREVWERLC